MGFSLSSYQDLVTGLSLARAGSAFNNVSFFLSSTAYGFLFGSLELAIQFVKMQIVYLKIFENTAIM